MNHIVRTAVHKNIKSGWFSFDLETYEIYFSTSLSRWYSLKRNLKIDIDTRMYQ